MIQLFLSDELFPLANDQPVSPPAAEDGSYYYREIWPLIVAQAFDRGWKMYACSERIGYDDQGHKLTFCEKTVLLDRETALAYRGTSQTECGG